MNKYIVLFLVFTFTQTSFAQKPKGYLETKVNNSWLNITHKKYNSSIKYYENLSIKFENFNKKPSSKNKLKIPKDLQDIVKYFDIKTLPKLRALKMGHISNKGPFQVYLNPIKLAYKRYSVDGFEFTFRGKTTLELRKNIIRDLSSLFKKKSRNHKKTSFINYIFSDAYALNYKESDGLYIGYRNKHDYGSYQANKHTANLRIDPNWPLKRQYMNRTTYTDYKYIEDKINGDYILNSDASTQRFKYAG